MAAMNEWQRIIFELNPSMLTWPHSDEYFKAINKLSQTLYLSWAWCFNDVKTMFYWIWYIIVAIHYPLHCSAPLMATITPNNLKFDVSIDRYFCIVSHSCYQFKHINQYLWLCIKRFPCCSIFASYLSYIFQRTALTRWSLGASTCICMYVNWVTIISGNTVLPVRQVIA